MYTTVDMPNAACVAMGGLSNLVGGSVNVVCTNLQGGLASTMEAAVFAPMVLGPTAPINLTATPGINQIALQWQDTSIPPATTTKYIILRSTSSGGGFVPVATNTGVANVTWTDTSMANYTTYYYEVEAANSGGSSAPSSVASATSVGITPIATGLLGLWGNNQVTLTWNASPDVTASYNVLRSTTSGSGYSSIGTASTSSYVDSTATNGTTYYYVVRVDNAYGESGNSAQVAVTPAAAPAQIAVLDGSITNVISAPGTNTISTSFTVSSGARVLVVSLFDNNGTRAETSPATLAWGSQTLSKSVGQFMITRDGEFEVCSIYYLYNPTPGTQTITAADLSAGVTAMAMQVYTLTGVDLNQPPTPYGNANPYTHTWTDVPPVDHGNAITLAAGTPVQAFAALNASVGRSGYPFSITILNDGGTLVYGSQGGIGDCGVMQGGVTNLPGGATTIALSNENTDGIGTILTLTVFAPAGAGNVLPPPPTSPTMLAPCLDATRTNLVVSVPTQTGYTYYLLSTPSLTPPVVWSTNNITPGTGASITNLLPINKTQRGLFLRYLCE
jgi:hypothetical protein